MWPEKKKDAELKKVTVDGTGNFTQSSPFTHPAGEAAPEVTFDPSEHGMPMEYAQRKTEGEDQTKIYTSQAAAVRNGALLKSGESPEPVFFVDRGDGKVESGYEVLISGPCRLVYEPNGGFKSQDGGAVRMWFTTSADVAIIDKHPK